MIDNFSAIKDLVKLENGQFLFGQIMVRKKDGSEFAQSNNKIVKDLVFDSAEDFGRKKSEIVAICEGLRARAYVNLSPRVYSDIAISMAGILLDYIRTSGQVACRSAFATACGRFKGVLTRWIIDVDNPTISFDGLKILIPEGAIVGRVPTVSGYHIITEGFDSREFKASHPKIDIHKNNPTLLYVP